jgi:hypothetical protein
VTEACRRCDVSRRTYYKWKKRYQEEGIDGLKNRSRRPKISPRRTDAAIESEIAKIKTECPWWGAYRIINPQGFSDSLEFQGVLTEIWEEIQEVIEMI